MGLLMCVFRASCFLKKQWQILRIAISNAFNALTQCLNLCSEVLCVDKVCELNFFKKRIENRISISKILSNA